MRKEESCIETVRFQNDHLTVISVSCQTESYPKVQQHSVANNNPFVESYQNATSVTGPSVPIYTATDAVGTNQEQNGETMIQPINVLNASASTVEECASELRTDLENGLPTAEAARRIQYSGYNEFEMTEKESLFKKYIEQFKNPLIALLLASAIVSLLMKQFDDAFSITIAVVIVVTVGFIQEYRSEKTLEKLNKLVPPTAHCIRDGRSVQFLARELVPGDLVSLTMGDRVPADVRIVEAVDLQIDESSFTGENEPRHKHNGQMQNPDRVGVERLDNVAFMGTLVSSGRGKGVVIGTGANSRFGEVFELMQTEESPRTPLQNSMDHLGTQLSFYSFGVIIAIFLIGLAQGREALEMFTIGVSLAVAAIPEGLPIVVAVTLAIGVVRMGNRNAVVKKLSAVETLGCVTVICSDKTGTLTQNEMTATVLIAADGTRADVSGVGYDASEGACVTQSNERVTGYSHYPLAQMIEVGCVCNNAQVIHNTVLGQPTEGALIVLGMKTQMSSCTANYRRVHEIPFNSENKWMAVQVERVNRQGELEVMIKGSLDKVLAMCKGYLAAGSQVLPLNADYCAHVVQMGRGMGNSGLRVIAMARGKDMNSLAYIGIIGIMDPPRSGCVEAIETVQSAGVNVKMITGDAMETACSIGVRLKLYSAGDSILSGSQIDEMSDVELERVIKSITVFYRTTPRHKLRIVKALQNVGEVVAMTGDGVNDAVALKKSDIGVAMGASGTDVCKEAADMVLIDDRFQTIEAAIEEGKGIYNNITNFIKFQLSSSVAALSLIAFSTLFHFENPMNAMQILWINIIMDGPPAQSLGVEPVDDDIIKQKQRNVKDPIINRNLVINVLSSAAIMVVGTLLVFYKEMSADNKITPRDITMTFTCFVLFDMWNALSCRSSRKMIWEIGLLRNRMFCFAVTGSVICQLLVIYVAPLQRVFQTEALHVSDLIFLTLLTSTVFIFNEAKKYYELRMKRGKSSGELDSL
ncbi:Calcium-transporting ATPase [Aphelenchoides besseyi]|nr:Calcium-transporting ATPase [Aphelenchoides besseyi]